jgi:hypothetical protein
VNAPPRRTFALSVALIAVKSKAWQTASVGVNEPAVRLFTGENGHIPANRMKPVMETRNDQDIQ